jgi:Trk K+ transport system NAD-binding subunit
MLEGDKYEVLDVRVRGESEYANRRFGDMPATGALIGAIVRNGDAIFPHRDDVLRPGDRVIVFSESDRVPWVEKTL